MSKLQFKLVPKAYQKTFDVNLEDPELPHIQRTYVHAYDTVFAKSPKDDVRRFTQEIVSAAQQAECALRTFMLAVMLGHKKEGERNLANADVNVMPRPFTAKMLTGKKAVNRARNFAALCNKEFGTFSLSSMATLVDEDCASTQLEQVMLNSETVAGKFIVGYKLRHGGPPWAALYDAHELGLDPRWLAIEQTYMDEIYAAHLRNPRGTQRIRDHRFSVSQVMGRLKKHRDEAIVNFQARETIMPKAVEAVLAHFGHAPVDFEAAAQPITDPLELWVFIGRAMQHYQCLKYLSGQKSMLDRW